MQDVVTDLNAEADQLPTEPRHDDWLGHKVRENRWQRLYEIFFLSFYLRNTL